MLPIRFIYIYFLITFILIWIVNFHSFKINKQALNRFLTLQFILTFLLLLKYDESFNKKIATNLSNYKEFLQNNLKKIWEKK